MIKNKKSQATIYMTLGVVLVSVVGLLYLTTYQVKKQLASQVEYTDVNSVKNYVDSCLDTALSQGIVASTFFGGYFKDLTDLASTHGIEVSDFFFGENYKDLTEPTFLVYNAENFEPDIINLENADELDLKGKYGYFAYYFRDGKPILPGKDKLEQDLSNMVGILFSECIGDFSAFENLGYDITYEPFEVSTKLNEFNTFVGVKFPIKIADGSKVVSFDTFSHRVEFSYLTLYNLVEEFVNEIENKPYTYLDFFYGQEHAIDFEWSYFQAGDRKYVMEFIVLSPKLNFEFVPFIFALDFNGFAG